MNSQLPKVKQQQKLQSNTRKMRSPYTQTMRSHSTSFCLWHDNPPRKRQHLYQDVRLSP
ncbi:MAG TPA: hypothetical protein V6D48_09800 [Oculatellaceae cyanobacterium]